MFLFCQSQCVLGHHAYKRIGDIELLQVRCCQIRRGGKPTANPAQQVRFGSEEQQNECALTLKKLGQAIWRML